MSYDTIRVGIDERGVARVVLNRPDKHNAMNAAMIAELTEAATRLAADESVRVVILSGEGPSFCAGGDLGWMRDQARKDRAGRTDEALTLARMLALWDGLPKPVIGQVHGAAYGGGIGLVAVCDLVIAEEDTRFALTETRLGLIPATIGPFVVRGMGNAFARQVFFTARPFDADFLLRAGLVARVCAMQDLETTVEEELSAILKCAPGAVADAKALCARLSGVEGEDAMQMTADALAERWETEEARAGIAAFFAREAPPWAPAR
ncbi:crotonase/enoyl-CoA hydratase family protein [Roseicyclus sp. F158]|uniref:Crotonase/enoyl-CoA hydratase family protein n=1 Tax=Tropicimonas omnivorans TaxID=3075590 RepID=A0ABU3DKR7_9RHOB|nr:crotonase/enoyl-CoA hydratase family protein [Roseicyclus sp. F158]MDT0684300.1 crotonase/enoyl-CoA hydratase family protein [Roseicyclus sp. F158]